MQPIPAGRLNRFVIFGQRHFDRVAGSYLDYDHARRPHRGRQGLNNELLVGAMKHGQPTAVVPLSSIRCQRTLGGLLKHDYRAA